jgi:hypothetical protein
MPAVSAPSPIAPARSGVMTFGASAMPARPSAAPPIISGADSMMAFGMTEGFCATALMTGNRPSASCTARFAACCSGVSLESRYCRTPLKSKPARSASRPAAPPETMSARPTGASATPTTPLASEIAGSPM